MTMTTVNGVNIAFERAGEGAVSVLFETGIGAESAEWESIFRQITQHTVAFRYDRAGRGQSGATAQPRSALEMSFDLDTVLEAANVQPPFLLVGHSFGGLLLRIFANRRPADVCGLLLVESMHPRQFEVLGPAFPEPLTTDPPTLRQMRTFWQSGWRQTDSTPEQIDFQLSMNQDKQVQSLGDLPIRQITAASFLNNPLLLDSAARERMQALWNQLQSSFLTLSSDTQSTYLERAGHFVQRDAPDTIVNQIYLQLHVLS